MKKPLGLEPILDAAFAILDHEGLDALSMRRVAQALETGPASLYAHVENKDELLELMLDRVIGEMSVPAADPVHWRDQLRQVAHDMRRTLVAHPGMAQVTLGRIPTGPNGLLAGEAMMAIVAASGAPDGIVNWWMDLLALYVAAHAVEETLLRAKYGADGQAEFLKRLEQLRDYLAKLPPERYPHTIRMAATMLDEEPDARFDFGLDVLLAGLESHAARARSKPAAPKPAAPKKPGKKKVSASRG
ncbi:MAG: TetR/AcrR family transcriptional regulator [Myxococcota bacterium]